MRIGFFDTQIESLLFFKEMVSAYPHNDFYFYAETSVSVEEMTVQSKELYTKAVMYLFERNVECICVASSIDIDQFEAILQMYTRDIEVVAYEGFESYAIEKNLSQQAGGEGVRSIHLTEHSPTTNERIALLLGGHFIEE